MGDQARRRCAASSAWTSSSAAGSPTRPPPSPYQLCSRMWSRSWSSRRPSAERGDGSAACSTRSSVSSAASGSSAGGRTGVTRADQCAGTLGPLVGQRRATVLEREPQPLQGQGAPMADERALQVEAPERRLPCVQVGEPGRDVVAGVARSSPRACASSERTSRHSSRVATGESSVTLHPSIRSARLRPARRDARPAERPGERRWRTRAGARGGSARRRRRRPERPGRAAAAHAHLGQHLDGFGAGWRARGWPGCGSAARRAGRRRWRGRHPRGAGSMQRELALRLEGPQPPGPVRRRGRLQGRDRLMGPARCREHLGAVLLAHGPRHHRQRREHAPADSIVCRAPTRSPASR